jgi:hypothetical protein
VNSTSKCTAQGLTVYLRRRLVVEALPGSIIQLSHDQRKVSFRYLSEVGPFREVVSEKTVRILVGPPVARQHRDRRSRCSGRSSLLSP